jgi:hypothetical protein
MPAKAHPADTLQLCKGQISGSQMHRTTGQVTGTHPCDIRAQEDLVTRTIRVAWPAHGGGLLRIAQPLIPQSLQCAPDLLLSELQLQDIGMAQPSSDSWVPLTPRKHTQRGECAKQLV